MPTILLPSPVKDLLKKLKDNENTSEEMRPKFEFKSIPAIKDFHKTNMSF